MRFLKFLLTALLFLVVVLGVLGTSLWLIQKFKAPFFEKLRFGFLSSLGPVEKTAGTVVLAYEKPDGFHFKVRVWDTQKTTFKSFLVHRELSLGSIHSDPEASPSGTKSVAAGQKISNLKLGDEVEVSFAAAFGRTFVLAVKKNTDVSRPSLALSGRVEKVGGRTFELSSEGELFTVGLAGAVKIGHKFQGILSQAQDFSSLAPEQTVQVIYAQNNGEVVIAQSVLILE